MEIQIPRNHELRLEVMENQKIKVMVISGLAEIFGQELLNEKWYNFTDIKCSIFTFTGAVVKIEGSCDLSYLAESSCFPKIFNYFDSIKDSLGIVIVVGRGRSTFCTTLANYFVRVRKKLDFLEVDPLKGNVFPGALSYLQIDSLVEYNDKLKLTNPYCLFFGSLSIENTELYQIQTEKLNEEVESRETGNFKVILCPELSNDMLHQLIKTFKASGVVCIGNERMFHRLNTPIPKIFIENTGYIAENTVAKSINRYFNGPSSEYTPSSFSLRSEYTVLRIGEQYAAPESALPLGASRKIGHTDVCRCELIQNAVLAISGAENEDQVVRSPALGFVVCVDEKKQRILCTQPRLPKCKYLVQGSVKYIDF
ncbi:uncharacterized protein VICG_00083 [Vittaforma corneae ATCC 50505]|uniref:Polynucleotide 5'-hydroxyl-kinase GRC3 n=1 Tax=Vittaforma corneae (strain ATCC 50505) TaxID=993615 RepID=L2GPF2_VITCO|nr:uncharacterized protein VICG_00083 [Vittaforma corneae ATCC 50505]ELA42768.1 hypothetical protein VICG_00083 [Vittaforma corneae ATCC 50505]